MQEEYSLLEGRMGLDEEISALRELTCLLPPLPLNSPPNSSMASAATHLLFGKAFADF